MDDLSDALDALAHDRVGDPVADLRLAGEQLVEALRDQLADGQTETLFSLSSGAQDVRTQVDRVVRASEQLGHTAAAIGSEVGAHAGAELQEALEAARTRIQQLADDTAQRAEDARTSMEWVVSTGADRLADAAAVLTQQQSTLGVAGDALSERLRTAALSASELIQVEAADAVALLEDAFLTATQALTERSQAVEAQIQANERAAAERLAAAEKQLVATERREVAAAERLQKHLDALVARIDATAGATLARIETAAAALEQRDAALEAARADAFVRVLDRLLSEGGAGGRKLRDRVRRGVEAQRAETPAAAAPVIEALQEPPPAPPTVAKAVPRKRAPKKES